MKYLMKYRPKIFNNKIKFENNFSILFDTDLLESYLNV